MKSWRTTILGVSLVFTGILNAVQAMCAAIKGKTFVNWLGPVVFIGSVWVMWYCVYRVITDASCCGS